MEGTTKAGTLLQAVVMSLNQQAPGVRAEADSQGSYRLDIDLGAQGICLITSHRQRRGHGAAGETSVTYASDLLPVTFTSERPRS